MTSCCPAPRPAFPAKTVGRFRTRLGLALLPALLLILRVNAQGLSSLIADFTRVTRQTGREEEVVTGVFSYPGQSLMLLHVTDPVDQWIRYELNSMLIYYPGSLQAFRIKSKNPLMMPFFQTFAGISREGFGLPELGFKLDHDEARGDTLLTYWAPPDKLKKALGIVTVAWVGDLISFTESMSPDRKDRARTEFDDYHEHKGAWYPLEFSTEMRQQKDTTFEQVVFSDAQFDVTVPDSLSDFEMPPETEIQEIEW